MFSKELFGQRLKEARQKNGETQEELGTLLSLHKSRVSEMEHGIASTTPEKCALICQHYGISADYLLCLSDDPKPHKRKKDL